MSSAPSTFPDPGLSASMEERSSIRKPFKALPRLVWLVGFLAVVGAAVGAFQGVVLGEMVGRISPAEVDVSALAYEGAIGYSLIGSGMGVVVWVVEWCVNTIRGWSA